MIEHRPFSALGGGDYGWLQARHHFAFAGAGRPEHRTIGALKVWNDDTIAPRTGFPLHPHRDIEIITYVREGAITHADSQGNVGRTVAGDVQVMTAGTGIRHSETNAEDVPTRIFQIWLETRTTGNAPRWDHAKFPKADRGGRLVMLASGRSGADGLYVDAAADVLGATARAGEILTYALGEDRSAYLVAASGRLTVNGIDMEAGDGIALHDEDAIIISALEEAEILLVALH